jgi:hypothetical protein
MVAMLAFPTAIFFSAAYAEIVFMAFALWAMFFFERNRALPAAACLALAALTRSHGMLLVASVVAGALVERKWKMTFVCAAVSGVAIGAYLYWQYSKFGDPLAFVHARRAWGFHDLPPMNYIKAYWEDTKNGGRAMEGWFDFVCIPWLAISGVFAWRRLGPAYGFFVLAILGVTMWQGQVWALGRIALCAFPGFILLGVWSKNRALGRTLLVAGISWVVMGGLRYVHGFFTGA